MLYLCGAINGCSDAECRDWRKTVKEAIGAKRCIDPMRRDYRGREDESVNEIVHGDYDDIKRCAVVLAAADRPSWGTAMEIHYGHSIGKPVIAVCGQSRVSPWLRYHCSVIVPTLAEAIERAAVTLGKCQ